MQVSARPADAGAHQQPPRSGRGQRTRTWPPRLASSLVLLTGALDLVSAVTRAERARLRELRAFVPGGVVNASTALTLVTGVLLLMLAKGLRRRKRRAWVLTTVLLLGSVALHILKGLDVEEAAVSAALLVGLVLMRKEFYALGDPRTRWRAASTFLVLLVADVGVGLALLMVREDALAAPLMPGPALTQVLLGLVGVDGPLHWLPNRSGAHGADLVSDSLLALGLLTLMVTAYLVLRPAEPAPKLQAEDESAIRALLGRHGRQDSLGYFATRRDKSALWAPGGGACICYRVLSGVMLASGDPVGEPGEWPAAIAAFLREADRHAWTPAVMGCGEAAGTAWSRAGLTALEIGDEAVLAVSTFSLEGRPMRNVRQAVARVSRAGYLARVCRVGDLTASEVDDVRRQAATWRGSETERGFSMALGRFGEPEDAECVIVLAHQDGRLRGLLHFVPWGRDGWSLDLMRRDREADSGVNELMIVEALRAAEGQGVHRLSLNFAVFRSALERGEKLGAGPLLRIWRGLLVFASRWFQIESLYRFNAKFRPEWHPRYVCYPSGRDLVRVVLAALEAEAFMVLPQLPALPWSGKRRKQSGAARAEI